MIHRYTSGVQTRRTGRSRRAGRRKHRNRIRDLHPHIRTLVEAFGPRRTFWGTDLTRMPCTYYECITLFTEHLPWLYGEDLEWAGAAASASGSAGPWDPDACFDSSPSAFSPLAGTGLGEGADILRGDA